MTTQPGFTLRPATAADALCLGVLATQVFLDTYATQGISAELAQEALDGYGPAFFAQRLARADVRLWVAGHAVPRPGHGVDAPCAGPDAPDHLVAFVELQAHSPCPVRGSAADLELVRLYVQQPFQGQGVGRRLLRLAEHDARQQFAQRDGQDACLQVAQDEAPRLWLTAWDGNTRARAFYSRCGWADVGATTHVIQGVGYANRVFVWPGLGERRSL